MDRTTFDQHRRHARVFKALGHATRLFLVRELGRGERCVQDLQRLVGADISTVSKHLAVLREAGVVRDERRGNQVFYSLAAPCVLDFMDCVEGVAAGNAPQMIQDRPPERRA
jgi:DNA-binding transcriptional ArsR family regulator